MNYEMMKLFVETMLTTIALSFITVVAILAMVLDSGTSEKKKFRLPWQKKTEPDIGDNN